VSASSNYEVIGQAGAPLVVVLGGISASRHVAASDDDPSPGWWDAVVGPGRAVDTTQLRVLGVDYLDGGRGSDGRPRRTVTTHEQAEAVVAALDALDAARAHAVVGASYGGMVALALAERFGERVERLIVISAPHEAHPMSTALRSIQRRIVGLGIDTGETREALTLARGLAMTTYRSAQEFAARFDSQPLERTANDAIFPVEGYLRHHGERFAAAWTPERFLALSLSADLHRVEPEAIRTPAVLVAAQGDAIVPGEQMQALAARLAGPTRLVEVATTRGHDAFLAEPDAMGRLLKDSLTTSRLS
jgi:homoserine O-acetyltransferase